MRGYHAGGEHAGIHTEFRFLSFPRKRESTQNNGIQEVPYKPESTKKNSR